MPRSSMPRRLSQLEALVAAGVITRPLGGVRLLGKGELKSKLAFEVYHASKGAIAAVEKAGGSVKLLKPAEPAPAEQAKLAALRDCQPT